MRETAWAGQAQARTARYSTYAGKRFRFIVGKEYSIQFFIDKVNGNLNAVPSLFGSSTRVFRAPGRVNLIGEHTDYNDGFVMPAAVEFSTYVGVRERADRKIIVRSLNFSETREFSLDDSQPAAQGEWSDYVRSVAVTLGRAGYHLRGAELVIRGEVPIGSGLSSSAALEVAAASALLAISDISLAPVDLARLCQRAENEFVGLRCGIMDQFISLLGQAHHAMLLDCRSLDYRLLPLPSGISLVICDSTVHHELAASEYNRRRQDCETGVRHLSHSVPQIAALRDVTPDDLKRYGGDLPDPVFRRCRHVITENSRVERAAAALERQNLDTFGQLMLASHASLRDDYEVSCPELDLLTELAARVEGVYGSRMTGAGFGGCTINLVRAESVDLFRDTVSREYQQATGKAPLFHISSAAAGAGEVKLS
jgi:galactokinase